MSPRFGTFAWISRGVPVTSEWITCGAYSAAPSSRCSGRPSANADFARLELGDVLLADPDVLQRLQPEPLDLPGTLARRRAYGSWLSIYLAATMTELHGMRGCMAIDLGVVLTLLLVVGFFAHGWRGGCGCRRSCSCC